MLLIAGRDPPRKRQSRPRVVCAFIGANQGSRAGCFCPRGMASEEPSMRRPDGVKR